MSTRIAGPVWVMAAAANELNLDLSEPQVAPMPSMLTMFLKLIVSLVVIVGLAYLMIRILRKNARVLSRGTNITVLDQYAFSLNKGVYITQVAGKVYVLGVTDHNISLIAEITDRAVIDSLVAQAKERENEPIIPPGILERILPGPGNPPDSGRGSFSAHINKQIRKLQTMAEKHGGNSRKDDRNE